MFPRISKFSNLSTTSGNISTASQQTQSTQQTVVNRRNDSSNIRNLLFGGGPEDSVPTPQKQVPNFHSQNISIENSQSISSSQNLQIQMGQPAMMDERVNDQQQQVLANMDAIENKINSKLQEIESLFIDRHKTSGSSNQTQGTFNPLDSKDNEQIQSQEETKGLTQNLKGKTPKTNKDDKKGKPTQQRQNSVSTSDRKQQAIQKVIRQNSLAQRQPQQNTIMQNQKSKTNLENDIQVLNKQQTTPNNMQLKMQNMNKLPPRNQPIKATANASTSDHQMRQTSSQVQVHNIKQQQQLNQDIEEAQLPSQSEFREFDNTYIYQIEKQLQQKTSENTKLKKKITTLEKQLEAKKQENEKVQQLQSILSKDGQIENTDERRIMILKAQNGQLTKHNAFLNDVLKSQKKIMIEVDHVLSDLCIMCKASDISKLEQKMPDILNNVVSMSKRLKSAAVVEQKEFNQHRFEDENPYYISSTQNEGFGGGKYDEDEKPKTFTLNREKILNVSQIQYIKLIQTEQKLSLLLENSLELYERCFSKKKPPNSNQFLRFCEDIRQSIEALLLLGIGINPEQSEGGDTFETIKDRKQALKDYVDKKLVAKIELDKHIIQKKLNADSCNIINQETVKQLNDIILWNNQKKQDKQSVLNSIISKIQNGELKYVTEIYLKQQQINILRAQYSKIFSHMNSLKQWFRQKVSNTLLQQIRDNIYEKFIDLESILNTGYADDDETDISSKVKLWSVFKMHYKDMKNGLEKVMSIQNGEFAVGDSQIEQLARIFEERVIEARDIVMSWD